LWQSGTIGINDVVSNQVFDMYPNPATNELHIINKQLISKIEIFNMLEQLQFTTKQSIIDISKLEKGVYCLMVTTLKGESISQKFIKQ
jgi:Secretion system C-terminal sorting domain